MTTEKIYNNGLGPIQLPPPRNVPPHVRAGMRGKLWIEPGGSVEIEQELWYRIVLHKTVTPYVLSGILSTKKRTVERRKPASKLSPDQIDAVLRRGGTPLDLYVGLVPDDKLRRLVEAGGRPGPARATADEGTLERENKEARLEITRLRAALERERARDKVVADNEPARGDAKPEPKSSTAPEAQPHARGDAGEAKPTRSEDAKADAGEAKGGKGRR
jgi:hypothetical protein